MATPGDGASAQVTADQPVPLLPAPVRGLTVATIGDRDGFPIGASGAMVVAPAFPEAAQAALTQLLQQPPNAIYFEPGYAAGFAFGGPEDKMTVACRITPSSVYDVPYNVYGVINGKTGKALFWPTVRSTPGQPCHSQFAAPPQ
jgi:hypothetical protein